jgi:spore coat protein CotH
MPASRTWVTVACLVLFVLVLHGVPRAQGGAAPQGPAIPGLPPGLPPDIADAMAELPLVQRFDASGDGRLNQAERQAARAWLAGQPPRGLAGLVQRFGGPGGPGAPGGPGRPGGPGGPAAGGRGAPPPFPFGGSGYATTSPGRRITPGDAPSGGSADLYDTRTLRTLFLEFENADWEQELTDFYNTDVEVPATLTMDGRTYRDVGVHFRGLSSFAFVPPGSKRSLNLAVDFVDEDQRVLGYRTLNLLNGNGDPTFVRPLLYSEIARQYIPAPKTNHLRVAINGESWGIYVNAQQFNADFINEWFKTRRGARWRVPGSPFGQGGMRYLGDDPAAYKGIYSIRTRDDQESWAALVRMFRVLNQTPLDRLEAELSPLLDVDGTLKFLALEVALVNSDGYWVRASDYNIYRDEQGRFHLIPHDINEAMSEEDGPPPGFPPPGFPPPGAGGAPGGVPPGFPPLPPGMQFPAMFGQASAELDPLVGLDDTTKPLRSRLLAVPALRERYLRYVRDIADRWLDWNTLEPLVRRYHGLIAAEVKADTRKLYTFEAFEQDVATSMHSLKRFADRRRAYLLKGQP